MIELLYDITETPISFRVGATLRDARRDIRCSPCRARVSFRRSYRPDNFLLQQRDLGQRRTAARRTVHLDADDEDIHVWAAEALRSVAPGARCAALLLRRFH